MDEFGLVQLSLVWFDEVDFPKCSRSASQLSFTNLLFHVNHVGAEPCGPAGATRTHCLDLVDKLTFKEVFILYFISSSSHSKV